MDETLKKHLLAKAHNTIMSILIDDVLWEIVDLMTLVRI